MKQTSVASKLYAAYVERLHFKLLGEVQEIIAKTLLYMGIHVFLVLKFIQVGWKSWKRRSFELTSTKLLRYFEDEEQQKFKGIINVSNILSILKVGDPIEPYWNYIIHLQVNADSEVKRQEWLKMLDEWKQTINYDTHAALFVDIIQNYDKCKERIKYIFDIYSKWCQSNNQFKIYKSC